jgi:hypothetical protein
LDPQLPHFRNLINLKICDTDRYPNDFTFISHYVRVKTVELRIRRDFDRLVRKILNLGTYKQLEVLRVERSLINKKTLELLIEHCPLLRRVELLGFPNASEEYGFEELKRQILLKNFDLTIKSYSSP